MRVAVLMAVGAVREVVLMVAHFSHGATAGAEAFAMTSGTAVAFQMVMIQADNAEELVVTATAMVVVVT